jgi:hypothetical protein
VEAVFLLVKNKRMNIYYAHSIKGSHQHGEWIPIEIISYLIWLWYQVVSEEIFTHTCDLSDLEIYDRDTAMIRTSDIVLANVSNPSLWVWYEIWYAQSLGKPVICFSQTDLDGPISSMITGNSYLQYDKIDMIPKLQKYIPNNCAATSFYINKNDIQEKDYVSDFSHKFWQIKTYLYQNDFLQNGNIHILSLEWQQMLFEAMELYKHKYYFWAAWLIWSFNEKYIREILINEKIKKHNWVNSNEFKFESDIEQEFEDSNLDDPELISLFDKIKWNSNFYNSLSEKEKQKIAWIKNNPWSYNNMIREMKNQNLINEFPDPCGRGLKTGIESIYW